MYVCINFVCYRNLGERAKLIFTQNEITFRKKISGRSQLQKQFPQSYYDMIEPQKKSLKSRIV